MPLELPGLQVYLRPADDADTDVEEIPVFKPDTVNSRLVTGFVPSEAGQSFEVCVHNELESGEGIVYTTYIDGREMYRFSVKPFYSSVMKGVYSAEGVRPFTFSELRLKEDDGEDPSFDISKLGLIEVRICRATITEDVSPVIYRRGPTQARLDPVSEKAKKIGWHSVSLGDVEPSEPLMQTHLQLIDPLSKPYAVFRFRYKPRELLEDEGIAPRAERLQHIEPSTGHKRPHPQEESTSVPGRAKRSVDQENVKPEPIDGSMGGSQLGITRPESAKRVKREHKIVDLTNCGASPIRVPVRGELIDLSND